MSTIATPLLCDRSHPFKSKYIRPNVSKRFDFAKNFICKIMVHCSWIGNDGFSFADLEKYQKRCSTEKSKYTFEYQHDVIPVYDASKIDLRPSSIIVSHHRS